LHHFAAKIPVKLTKSTPKYVQVPANEDIASSCTKREKVLFLSLQETHLQVLHLQELATLSLAYVRAYKQTNKQTDKQTKIEKENKKKRGNITQDILSPSSTLTHRSRDKHKQILNHLIPQNMGFKEEVENKACRRGSA